MTDLGDVLVKAQQQHSRSSADVSVGGGGCNESFTLSEKSSLILITEPSLLLH